MHSDRILITGGSGFLGWNLLRDLGEAGYSVTGTRHRGSHDTGLAADWVDFDLECDDPVELFSSLAPSLIIHCAALSKRGDCDRDPERAEKINVRGTDRLTRLADTLDIPFAFISTDLVFDGTAAPYAEDHEPSPESVYARTKAEAERVVARRCQKYYIIRTALMYGRKQGRPASFLEWTAAGLAQGNLPPLYANQFRTPLFVGDVAYLIHRLHSRDAPYGIYHAGGPDRLSRYDMGISIAEHMGMNNTSITAGHLNRNKLSTDEDDTSLNTEKAQRAAAMTFTTFDEGMKKL